MTVTTTTNPGWRIQLAIHRAVRRDVSRLTAALAGGGEIPVEAVRTYWDATAAQLHHHHEFEDTGEIRLDSQVLELKGGQIEGSRVRFVATGPGGGSQTFTGTVNGTQMSGETQGGGRWSATRVPPVTSDR